MSKPYNPLPVSIPLTMDDMSRDMTEQASVVLRVGSKGKGRAIPYPPTSSQDSMDSPLPSPIYSTPVARRDRSDTMLTASSSNSSLLPTIQTPPTPSILNILSQNYVTSSNPDRQCGLGFESPGDGRIIDDGTNGDGDGEGWYRPRSFSYSFGKALEASPNSIIETVEQERQDIRRESETSVLQPTFAMDMSGGRIDHQEDLYDVQQVERILDLPPDGNISTSSTFPTPTTISYHVSEFPFPPMSLPMHHHQYYHASEEAETPAENHPGPPNPRPEPSRNGSSFKSAVRRKLSRSKSSFRSITPIASRNTSTLTSLADGQGADNDAGSINSERPRKHRFRSLLSLASASRSRAGSTASLQSVASTLSTLSTTGPPAASLHANNADHSGLGSPATAPSLNVIARDFGSPISAPAPLQSGTLDADVLSSNDFVRKDEIKAKTRNRVLAPFKRRPSLLPTMSVGPGPSVTPTSVIAHPRARAISSPYPNIPTVRALQQREKPRPVNLFGTMLPRELQLGILKTLVQAWINEGGDGRWDGEVGGRRELIKLTRVSKSWRSLCLDGQLWSTVNFTPLAARLHPSNVSKLITSTAPFITTFCARGLDKQHRLDLAKIICESDIEFTSLTTLDFGKTAWGYPSELCQMIERSPNLKTLNLKGVQAPLADVIRTLRRSADNLENLDMSRCYNLSLSDLAVYIRQMTIQQAEKFKVLRVSGLRGYGRSAAEFVPLVGQRLVNLEVLDLLGCGDVADADFTRLAEHLKLSGRTLNLKHLVLSGCTGLSITSLSALTNLVPHLRCLEIAGLPHFFDLPTEGSSTRSQGLAEIHLIKFLRSVPKIQKIDFEGTGLVSGISDAMLDCLTPGKGVKGVVGSQLTELRLGFAKQITARGLVRLIRGCDSLRVLEVDNTGADNAVMQEFHRRSHPSSAISLMDCRSVTSDLYQTISRTTRPREGWLGWDASPFTYTQNEIEERAIVKTFWSWKRVGVPLSWTVTRAEAEEGSRRQTELADGNGGRVSTAAGGSAGRRGSWWRDDEFDDRGCVVM